MNHPAGDDIEAARQRREAKIRRLAEEGKVKRVQKPGMSERNLTTPRPLGLAESLVFPQQVEVLKTVTNPFEYHVLPVRCYTCAKIIHQPDVEQAILDPRNARNSLTEILANLGYIRVCCVRTFMSDKLIVSLERQREQSQKIVEKLTSFETCNRLTLQESSAIGSNIFTNTGFFGKSTQGRTTIVNRPTLAVIPTVEGLEAEVALMMQEMDVGDEDFGGEGLGGLEDFE
ncbi:MAG: hypothetical protein ACYCQJ_13045 [Nitrososphaerales archaeon]